MNKNLKTYKELGEDPASLEQRTNIMKQLMIDLTNFENIPPCGEIDKRECALARKYFLTSPTADQGQNKSELTNFFCPGEVYECATFLSVEKKDIEEFERNICVLKSYYDEFDSIIGKSQRKNAILGLYLLYLLSYNK